MTVTEINILKANALGKRGPNTPQTGRVEGGQELWWLGPRQSRKMTKWKKQGLYEDQELERALALFFINEGKPSAVDLGCGLGTLVKQLRDHQIKCDGFDGNPSTPEITSWIDSKPPCRVADLSEPILFPQKYDWAISLEVGEHIPKEFEDEFINNLHNNNIKGIILSWAIKGQPGHGHVNCQNNDYIKSKFLGLGYINDINVEEKLRKSSTLKWFKNTIMVFRKPLKAS